MSTIKSQGWRQGSVFYRTDSWSLQSWFPSVPANAFLILITHTCSVVNASYQKEPRAEFLVACRTDKYRKDVSYGRNSRQLSMKLVVAGKEVPVLANIYDKYTFGRHWLEDFSPANEVSIPENELRTLTTWLSRRYTRPAFPNEFNIRIGSAIDKIKKRLKKADVKDAAGCIASVGLDIPQYDIELPEDEDYELGVTLIIDSREFELHRAALSVISDFIDEQFSCCTGIAFIGVDTVGDDVLTVAASRSLKLYDFDNLSLQDDGAELLLETDI
ncbi:MAG: hypothetical protein V7739_04720 [Motiliproteus sp.]